jgi:hypothetical protein
LDLQVGRASAVDLSGFSISDWEREDYQKQSNYLNHAEKGS